MKRDDPNDEAEPDETALGELAEPGDTSAAIDILAREAGVPPDTAARLVRVVQRYSGPMPPPQVLAQYDDVLPGSANRMLQMAEKEQEHRHRTTDRVLMASEESDGKGKNYALAVVLIMTIGAVVCAALGQAAVAMVLGGGTLISLVAAFLGARVIDGSSGDSEPAP